MPKARIIKTAFNHEEGSSPRKYEHGLRIIKNGNLSVSVKRTAGTAEGTLRLSKSDSPESANIEIGSASWGNESVRVIDDIEASFNFLVIEANFTDSNFGQLEISITTS